MTSGPNPLHFLSSRFSTFISGFSWKRFSADIVDLMHKCVAVLLVYATVAATMPVRAVEALGSTAGPALASSAMTMTKTTPTITWATPAAITYGTALSSKQLDATASVAGTFAYTPAAGTVLAAGTQKLSVTFTPTNTTQYNTATDTVSLTVNKATPVITWATPAAINYGTALSATQLDATANVAGTFVYSPAAGTVLAPGTQKLSVTFTPTNTTDYCTAAATVSLTVNKATPVITWATPAAITYGTALSATQLDATANVAGKFVYSPAAGTVLAPGTQKLSVTFTPTNTTDYCTAAATVSLTVNKATPVITWATPAAITYGTALSATQLDATASVAGTFVYTPPSGTVLAAGTQTLSVTFTPTNTTDYASATATVALTVKGAIPVITWAAPAAITYGTALSATQLDATASVAGTFVYTPASGTVLAAGTQTLSVTFTPTNTTGYSPATATVSLTVNKASQTISFTPPVSPVTVGVSPITLTATASSGLPVTFSVVSGPGTVSGSTLTITGVGTVVVAANQAGNTNYAAAPQVTQSVVVNYSTPIANAGAPQTVYVGTTVQLNGTGSSDPAGLPLTYLWSFVSVPAGSTAALSSTTAAEPTFVADKAGTYNVQLIVNNGHNNSTPSTVTITSQNQPPVANAGPPQTVYQGQTVQLNGTGSYDPAGLPITYQWSFVSLPSGSGATLSGATTPLPTFLADKTGNYVVQLIVNNGVFSSSPSTVTITTQNSPPVANAGPNQSVNVQSTVQLSGSGSTDINGDPLTYTWSFVSIPSKSKAVLTNPNSVNPTFIVDVSGNYVVQLIVNDGYANSVPATVTISTIYTPPVANAGPNQTITVTGLVQLNGSGSTDVNGNPLTYSWSSLSLPQGSTATLSNPNAVNPTFVADVLGTYVFQLVVNDSVQNSTPATVTITSSDVPPVANPGSAQMATIGSIVNLNGSASTDSDHQQLTYQWSMLSKPPNSSATLSDATSATPYFTPDESGNYVVQLIVNDGYLNSTPATVVISTTYIPPVANAGPNQTVNAGSTVQLSGTASTDTNGNPLAYSWAILSQPSGGSATLSNATIVNPTFVANLVGTYVVQLIVNDGTSSSAPVTTTIIANAQPPVVNAGQNQTITLPVNSVTLSGSATDNGVPLTFTWSVVSGPGTVTFSNPSSAVTTATFGSAGTYVLQLTASNSQNSASGTTTVTVNPQAYVPPVVNAGPNQTITLPASAVTLNGSASDNGAPMTIVWTVISGPGTVIFSSPNSLTTQATFPSTPGTYVLQLSASNPQYTSTAQVTITVNQASIQTPVVNAGPNQTITLPTNTVTLNGSATDNGVPMTVAWSVVSGPTTVTFSSPSTAVTQATFTAPGAYVLQLSASNMQYTATSQTAVYVYTQDNGQNQAPYVNAGPNQTISLPAAAQLNGLAVDDGLPNGTLTISWSVVSGPGTVTFASASSPVTTASFSMAGTYVLQLAADDSQYLSTSNVTITVGKMYGHGGYKGTDFWLTFPANYDDGATVCCGSVFQPQLLITSDVNNSGTVTIPGVSFSSNFTVSAGQGTSVQIPTGAVLSTNDVVENYGIHVTSASAITVVGFSYYTASTDGYLALPTPILGTSYIVMAYPYAYYGSELAIVAAQDGTTVSITPSVTVLGRAAGQPYNIILNQGRTYELISTGGQDDLTGTIITSDKPIALWGGNQAAAVPDATWRYLNHIVEELLPTDLWGENFLVEPYANQPNGDIVRVQAAQNGTNVSINGSPVATLNQGQFYEEFETAPVSISASAPVQVAQFETGEEYQTHTPFGGPPYGTFLGDPSMTLVSAYEQFAGHYTVLIPSTGFPSNYVNVVAPTSSLSGLLIDRAPVSATFTPIPGSLYSGAQVPVSTGVHYFDGTAPFGVTVTGFAAYDSYSYQAGLAFDAARAGTTIVLTPTAVTQQTGTQICVTASLLDAYGNPPGGIGVGFTVTGANVSNQSVDSNVSGQSQYCYIGTISGTDTILASIGGPTATGSVTWSTNAPNRAPFVYPGSDQVITLPSSANLLGVVSDDGLPLAATLTTTWSQVSGPGTVSFANAGQPVTTAMFSAAGTYDLRLTANDSQLSSYADLSITVNPAPQVTAPVVNPGPDQTVTLPLLATLNGIVTDNVLPPNGKLIAQWAEVSGPANASPVVFANPSSAYTTATFSQAGTYVLSLTGDNSQLQTTAQITITVLPAVVPPAVICPNGGSFTAQFPTNTITLNCTVSDSSLPQGGTLTQQWSQSSGPAVVSFATPSQATTVATFPVAGSYTLYLTADNTLLTTAQEVFVTVSPANTPPVVNITNSYQTITLPTNTATLSATVTDNSPQGDGTLTQLWTQTYGPAATISTPTATSTQITFTTVGQYNFQLAATYAQYTTTAGATVVVNPAPVAPTVYAGPNQAISLPTNIVTLNGTIGNPGVPTNATVTTAWSELSGPTAVTFSSPSSLSTQATFTTAGTYVLQLAGTNTGLTSTSTLTVTVYAAPQNLPPVVSAGPNFTVSAGTTTYIVGSATDPAGLPLTLVWSQLSGPAPTTIYYPNSTFTYVSFPVVGTYVLQLSASDPNLTSAATVTATVTPALYQPPSVSAGGYQTITLPTNTLTLNGYASSSTGTVVVAWSEVSGPAMVTFSNPNQVVTQATFPVAGSYQLQLAASANQLISISNTYITVNPADSGPSISFSSSNVNSLTLPNATTTLAANITLNAGSSLSLTWSEYDGPGPVTFSSPNSTVTDATFTVAGNYYLQLAASDGTITNTSSLTIYVKPAPVGGPPVVSLNTPQDGQQVSGPLAITGVAFAQTENQGGQIPVWTLAYSLNTQDGASTQNWITLTQSNFFTQAPQTLATLDPTVLLNGTYSLQLTATDSYGQTSSTSTSFVVSKNAKPGDFTLAFNDLTVPVAGLPIAVTRSYDSRDHGFHDFGPSWSLSLNNIRIEKNRNLGKNWVMNGTSGGLFGSYCVQSAANVIVTVSFPGGAQYLFQAAATPACSEIVPPQSATIGFTELPGGSPGTASATLVPADGGQVLFDNSGSNFNLVDYDGNPYNPTQFILTTSDGHSYTIDQTLGVSFMSDANGNSLTIGSSGIVSSTGKSITFTRDSLNRITKITDPNGNTLQYNYTSNNPSAMLEQFIDASGNTTTFNYFSLGSFGGGIPELNSITNAQGVTVAAAQYDSAGHMTQLTDANGKTTAFNINENTQTETVTDPLGNATTYTYDADGNILTEADALGNTTTNTFDSDDNKLTVTDPLGHTTTYTYDASDNRLTQTDPLGNTTSYTYNQRGQALTVADPLGHTTTNVYDANGNLTSSTDANGKTTSTVYSSNGLPTSLTDANGNTTQLQYDGSGNLTQQTDALGNIRTYTYDANNNRLSQTVTRTVNGQSQTLTTGYQYDGSNRLIRTTYPDGSTTQTQYNSIGKQSATIDQLGHQTSYAYDSAGRLITTTYPDNTTESTTYDANGNRLTSTDRAGHTTSYAYDADNRLSKTTYADNSFTQSNYDTTGRVSSTIDADNNTTSYSYDNAGRRTSLTDALSHVTNFTYDNSGNQIAVKDARGNITQYQYDALNRKIAVVYPDQTTSTTSYDNLSRVISRTDQAGKVTAYGYDALGRLTSATQDAVTGGLNLVTTYGYDQIGNRISQTDANNHTTTYAYDQLGRRVGRTLPAGQSESYTYDAAGNLKTKVDFNGKTTTYAYDTSNRLLSKTPDPSFSSPGVSFIYTSNGLRQTMLDVSGTTTYGYDTRNRLTSKQTPFGTLSYTYDAAGNLLTLKSSNSGGASDTYTYDQLNRLSTVTDPSGGTTYAYDAVGNLQNFVYPNAVTHAYSYDTLNRLTQMGASANGAAISNYAYTLGLAGNRLAVAELSGRNVAYGYDSLYRLTSEMVSADPDNNNGAASYTYDSVGNRKTLNTTIPPAGGNIYTYDADDRLGSDQYDPDGNTINSFGTANTYDFENHLVTHGGVTIVYDGDGNRVSETVGGVTTNYLVDTKNPTGYPQVVDELQSGSVTRTYSYGLERISEKQSISGTSTVSFYGYDGHGNVRQLTNSTGAVTDTYDYDAFGNLINSTGSTQNNYLFAGEEYDPALSLYYNRARYLNTTTGRFWSMDSYEGNPRDPLSLHKYLYTADNPVNHFDRSGHEIDLVDVSLATSISTTLAGSSNILLAGVMSALFKGLPSAIGFGFFYAPTPYSGGFGSTLSAGPIGGLEIVFIPGEEMWELYAWGSPLEGTYSLPAPMGPGEGELGLFGAWYWNVTGESNFTGIAGLALAGNFYGIEQSGSSTALLFGISDDEDPALFGIGTYSRKIASGTMSEEAMITAALGEESLITIGSLVNYSESGLATNGLGGLAALIINNVAVGTWIDHTWGQP